jgi:hypothetical protein
VALVWLSTRLTNDGMSSAPLYTSSHLNSGVYVVVRVLQPLLQTKTLPWSFEDFLTPAGNSSRNRSTDSIFAVPLIEASGLSSKAADI